MVNVYLELFMEFLGTGYDAARDLDEVHVTSRKPGSFQLRQE
jgi:hypothetical protein